MMVYNQTPAELRVYVADLADYNAGILRGAWFDPTDYADADEFGAAVDAMIRQGADENGVHEEWAIHDYEAPTGVRIDEYESLSKVWDMAYLFSEYGAAYAAYLSNIGAEYATETGFTDSYCGEYESMREFVLELFEDDVNDEAMARLPFNCIDWDSVARSIEGYSFVDGYVFMDV
jgi:antirestriction protein